LRRNNITPLASLYLSTILIHRIAFLILLYSSLLSYNTLYVIPLSSGTGILGGLFQITLLSQSLEIFILIIGSIILLKSFNSYVDTAEYLGYSAFTLAILEYIDITNLSKDEAKLIILEREQHYLDTLSPEYNIFKIAGSSLGFKHSEETRAIMSLNNKGKIFDEELKALLSEIKKGVPLIDKHKSFISQTKKGVPLTDALKTALSKARENIVFSDTHKMNMSIANGT